MPTQLPRPNRVQEVRRILKEVSLNNNAKQPTEPKREKMPEAKVKYPQFLEMKTGMNCLRQSKVGAP